MNARSFSFGRAPVGPPTLGDFDSFGQAPVGPPTLGDFDSFVPPKIGGLGGRNHTQNQQRQKFYQFRKLLLNINFIWVHLIKAV
ncbi:hypothetical protein BJP34_10125 [Moorena producens PAL-8-15-08-1]|uniref:Uncharacterized protein n=1 Tax=Moorena producens PAL-8-15-08-1 TaxID=1458985 RepID=A0A1D8TQS7_9CYAN|nr:hypothetical protein BJP34_10125 [Moorena producens PAL-8-15-08-1]